METNIQRIKEDIETLSRFSRTPGRGCTRFSYSPEDRKARDYITKQCLELGLSVNVDAIGNIRARMEGTEESSPIIMVGSHIDTVQHGGNYDGIVGVVGALEAIRTIKEHNLKTKNPIEMIIFAEEEGSNYGTTMVGSKAITGKYKIEDLHKLKDQNGVSCYQMTRDFGLNPDKLDECVLSKNQVKAMLELHIEQSVVLENMDIPVGIVEAISGMATIKIKVEGVPNHAGATPMNMRNDPMVGGAKLISEIERIAREKALTTTVATVGRISCSPNVPNVIPKSVEFTVDIRDVDYKGIEITRDLINKEMKIISDTYGLKVWSELIGESDSIHLSKNVSELIEESAKELDVKYMRMNSGAVHDSAMLAGITDVGMIFVQSKDGRSHVPEEFTEYEHIKLGCDVLLRSIMRLAK